MKLSSEYQQHHKRMTELKELVDDKSIPMKERWTALQEAVHAHAEHLKENDPAMHASMLRTLDRM